MYVCVPGSRPGRHARTVCLAAETRMREKYSTRKRRRLAWTERLAIFPTLGWYSMFRAADDAIVSLMNAKGQKGKGEIGRPFIHSEMGGTYMRTRVRQVRIAGLVSSSHVESSNWCVSGRDGHGVLERLAQSSDSGASNVFPNLPLRKFGVSRLSPDGVLVVAVDKVSTFAGSPSLQASDGTLRDAGAIRGRGRPRALPCYQHYNLETSGRVGTLGR